MVIFAELLLVEMRAKFPEVIVWVSIVVRIICTSTFEKESLKFLKITYLPLFGK